MAFPTSAVYALDLGFVLPIFAIAAILLLRRSPSGAPLALGSLVFLVLMALSILPIFAIEATRGALRDPVPVIVFAAIVVVSAVLAGAGLTARPTAEQRDSAPPLAAPPSLSGF